MKYPKWNVSLLTVLFSKRTTQLTHYHLLPKGRVSAMDHNHELTRQKSCIFWERCSNSQTLQEMANGRMMGHIENGTATFVSLTTCGLGLTLPRPHITCACMGVTKENGLVHDTFRQCNLHDAPNEQTQLLVVYALRPRMPHWLYAYKMVGLSVTVSFSSSNAAVSGSERL